MPEFDVLVTFAFAALMLSLSPGPSNLYIMARTMNNGHSSGISAAGGMAVGSFIYVIASALGIAAVFVYSPTAFLLIKVAGALYLIFLGISTILSARHKIANPVVTKTPVAKVFRQSIVVELTNPKTALFFIAFLPQFVAPTATNVVEQLIVLGSLYALIAFCCDLFVVAVSAHIGKWLAQHPLFVAWQDRLSGSILFGLGGFILYQEAVD